MIDLDSPYQMVVLNMEGVCTFPGLVHFLSGISVFGEKMYGITVFYLLPVTGNCLIICRYFGILTLKGRYFSKYDLV